MPSFPVTGILDTFKRANENPLFNSGKWLEIGTSKEEHTGQILSEKWQSVDATGEDAAYWWEVEYEIPLAVALELPVAMSVIGDYLSVWATLQQPGTGEPLGLKLSCISEGPGNLYTLKLEKYAESGITTVLETEAVEIPPGGRFGITVEERPVEGIIVGVWHKTGAGSWEEQNTAELFGPETFLTGASGISVHGLTASAVNFEVAGEEAKPPETPEVENPGTQHRVISKPTSLQIKATFTTEYKATGLPEGMSINEGTGLISGTPTKLETATVKVTVKGPKGENSTEFEWVIEEAAVHKKNRTFMIL